MRPRSAMLCRCWSRLVGAVELGEALGEALTEDGVVERFDGDDVLDLRAEFDVDVVLANTPDLLGEGTGDEPPGTLEITLLEEEA